MIYLSDEPFLLADSEHASLNLILGFIPRSPLGLLYILYVSPEAVMPQETLVKNAHTLLGF